jgi:hypothetical protein
MTSRLGRIVELPVAVAEGAVLLDEKPSTGFVEDHRVKSGHARFSGGGLLRFQPF